MALARGWSQEIGVRLRLVPWMGFGSGLGLQFGSILGLGLGLRSVPGQN